LRSDRAVFNFKSNDYRLVVAINRRQIVFIKWLDRAGHDKIDVKTM
jgi:mRNA-degrading endonuclease HigB of HigAB toxin-antitoxin module